MKEEFKVGTMLYPLPVVMVSCGDINGEKNIVTVAWTGTINTEPPMCYISLRKSRHSHRIISETKEFVINIATEQLACATDWCGVKSGRDFDKFREMRLTPVEGRVVKAPLIGESPLNLECKVKEIKELGSHDMFIAEVVAVNAESTLIDKSTGQFQLNHVHPLAYSHGKYYKLGEKLGSFGYSVNKKMQKK
ncbi:MAG: flavin reductase family protein [Bacteroidales bacterium]|nr:flavin reductase family protein [Bacteroidales bacterium]